MRGNRSLILFDRGDEVVVQAGDQEIRFLLVSGKPILVLLSGVCQPLLLHDDWAVLDPSWTQVRVAFSSLGRKQVHWPSLVP